MKLIVSDFDLTLFDSNYNQNIELVNSFTKKGNIFVIATGRSFELLKKDIENKNINFKYLICSAGSVILDNKFNILKSIVFETNIVNEIIDLLKKDINLISLEIDRNKDGISGIYCIFNSIEYAKKKLNDILNKYDVSGYVSNHGINIINKDVSKVNGIEYIKNIININDDDIYTIGDNINDLEMITKYNGYIIGNSNIKGIKVDNFKDFIEKIADL